MTEPDFDNDDLNPDDDSDDQQQDSRNLRALRAKARKYDTEVEPLRRENAFYKAGIPDTPHGKLLRDAYKGELTAEAIRKAAVEYGVLDDSEQEDVPADERAAIGRADAASAGGSFTPPKAPDMNQAMRQATGRGRM